MSILARFFGLVAALAYALQRAKIGFLRLRAGVVFACLLLAAYAGYRGWRAGFLWSHGAVMAICLLLAALLLWADRRHYIVFREQPARPTDTAADLRAEEKLSVRGSGAFEVNNLTRYLVEVPTVFWTTQLGDHIVAARVRALNLLGVGVPLEERGWWYIFIEPRRVLDVTAGELCFGFGLRPAVCVLCEAPKNRQLVYLSCDSAEQQARLLKGLQTKARAAHQSTP